MTAGTGSRIELDQLRSALHGTLVTPDHPEYDAARAVYNGMIDKRPLAIARCVDVDDVRTCLLTAQTHELLLAIRGGGHNAGGLGIADDALVVDLSPMRRVDVDAENRTVRVDAGCTWGEVDAATCAVGLATPSGIVATTGVAGLTLGGGIGNLSRAHGLTIDNLLAADVVLADGTLVRASATSHPELFWALRGGGGNFGVVTSFEFRLHPVGDHGTVIGGPVFYDLADTAAMLKWYRDRLPTLPGDLNAWAGIGAIPAAPFIPEELHGRPAGVILWCYSGPHTGADDAMAPVSEFGSPLFNGVGPIPFPALQSALDALYPPGYQWYWRGDFFDEITDAAIETHLAFAATSPSSLSTMHLYPIDGAAATVDPSDTAFANRRGGWAGVIVGVDPSPDLAPQLTSWVKDYWEALHPTSTGGAYVNFLMEESHDRVQASYRQNWQRLTEVKRTYDPQNLFRVNQNIPPAPSATD